MIFAIFRAEGNIPLMKDLLKRSGKILEISFLSKSKIFVGIPLRPWDLPLLRFEIISEISLESVGEIKKRFMKHVVEIILKRFKRTSN